jgi:hypothetical protein
MKIQSAPIYLRQALPVFVGLAWLLLAACSTATSPQPSVTATQSVSPAATQPMPTEPSAPTATPLPGKAWLVTPADAPALQDALAQLAGQAGWLTETRPDLQVADLAPEVRVVVFTAPPANLSEMQAAAPQVQFVVVSPVDLPAGANLSVIRQRPEYQAFVAGHIASLYAADWRSAGLLPADGPLGMGLQEAFVNGGRYFCGMCAPGWPLRMLYPQVGALPASSDGAAWLASATEQFDTNKVNLFVVSNEAAQPEVFDYLQGKDQFGVTVRLVGFESPPAEVADQWLVTVRFDTAAALAGLWPQVAAGQGGQVLEAPVVLADIEEENRGVGRMRLIEDLLQEIAAGRIYPFLVPPQ